MHKCVQYLYSYESALSSGETRQVWGAQSWCVDGVLSTHDLQGVLVEREHIDPDVDMRPTPARCPRIPPPSGLVRMLFGCRCRPPWRRCRGLKILQQLLQHGEEGCAPCMDDVEGGGTSLLHGDEVEEPGAVAEWVGRRHGEPPEGLCTLDFADLHRDESIFKAS